jgi:hypothetical protein
MNLLIKFAAWHIESKNMNINAQAKLSTSMKLYYLFPFYFIVQFAVLPKGEYFCVEI